MRGRRGKAHEPPGRDHDHQGDARPPVSSARG
jgi:hypothetical protein